MYYSWIMMLSLISSFTFMQTNHPLMMMIIIILQTLFICLLSGFISQSFWFSYILFLVFLGGMLVLFIYISSLASNEILPISMKMIMFLFSSLFLSFFILSLIDSSLWASLFNNADTFNFFNSINLYSESTFSLIKLYNNPTSWITLLLVMYLFLTLIAIVKITNIFQGPLRQKN